MPDGGWGRSSTRCAPTRRTRSYLRRRTERGDLALPGQPLQRLRLDLPDALARDPQLAADLLERLRVWISVHAVAELDHLLLAVGQALDRASQRVFAEADDDLLLDVPRLVGEELSERGIALAADGLVEARDRPRRRPHLADVLRRE